MEQIANYIANLLGKKEIIRQDDIAICCYGLEMFLSSVLEFLSIMLLAFIGGNFLETLLFFIAFIPLRIYAGGYHADTRLRCYGILVANYMIFSLLLKTIPVQAYTAVMGISVIFSFGIVAWAAPIVSHHKHVNQAERKHYKKLAVFIVLSEIFLIVLGVLLLESNRYLFSFTLGQASVALAMLAALIKNRLKKEVIK